VLNYVSGSWLPSMFFILIAVLIASFVAVIWALIDSVSRSDQEFAAVGSSRILWIVLIVFGTLLGGMVGLAAAIVYLAAIRPKMQHRGVST
jgi:heme A synthase